jgi:DNA mismatch repair protein MutL
MTKVQVLAPDVIAKIAAGEVVDRPASAIKELLENSLDAGATSVEIHLKDAGKELIHIKDNGSGISKENLEKLFNRHATSKIQSMDDLEKLSSMGFRGEALYSIAAVSDVTLRSQTKSGSVPDSWSIHVRGGERLSLEPAAPSGQGTDIKISELFFNTPARRKFLKSNTSEMNAVVGVVLPYALIYPDKRFQLTHAGRTLVDLKPSTNCIDRVAEALNLDAKNLLETSQDYPQEKLSVRMILGNINIQRPRRDSQYFFINNRPVESKALGFCMNDVYRMVFPPGVYPAFVLDIHLDPSEVDVNIHPTKREVKLRGEARLCSIVRHLTEYTLMKFGSARIIDASAPVTVSELPAGQLQSPFNPARYMETATGASTDLFSSVESSADLFRQTSETLQTKFATARFIGAFMNKYLLFEQGTTLMLVDQHAAQERIMFEKFQKQIEEGTIEVQPLLTPVLIKMNISEKIVWDEMQDKLKEVGIETTLFDEETLAVQTQPLLLKNIENAVRMLLSGDDVARCDRNTLARRACKASIVTGDRLSPQQVEYQRQQLLACDDPFTCPHGRPTVIEITDNFLEKQFLRI